MKKKYISPTTHTFLLTMGPVLTVGSITEKEEQATTTPTEEEYDGNDWGSRRRSVWSDDEADGLN